MRSLNVLADPTRQRIVEMLATGALSSGEIARRFDVSAPAISQHLGVLKRANLVTDRAAGTRRVYAVNPEAIESLRQYFDRFWVQALAAFKKRVEGHPNKEER